MIFEQVRQRRVPAKLRLRVLETPGHSDDSMSLLDGDRGLRGDVLLRTPLSAAASAFAEEG